MSARFGSRATAVLASPWVFRAFLVVNLVLPFCTHFYPTLDGPAHLYNAQLLKCYLLGDEAVRAWFELHPLPVPNWLDHALLAGLLTAFPGWMAEKALVLIYIATMALGFRRLLRTLAPGNEALALLVFPLIHGCLFNMGFFNFSLGVALWFFAVAEGVKWLEDQRNRRLFVLTALGTLLYFSNVLAFALAGFTLGCALLWNMQHAARGAWSQLLRQGVMVLLVLLPGLICFAWFSSGTDLPAADGTRPLTELLDWLWTARPLKWTRYAEEGRFALLFVVLLAALLVPLAFTRRQRARWSHVLLPPMLLVLTLYFVTPDTAHAGMMSDRYCYLFFIVFSALLATAVHMRWHTMLLACVAGLVQLALTAEQLLHTRLRLDVHATAMHNASRFLDDHATVQPVNLSSDWNEGHLSNYLGTDRPLFIMENYEARLGWFPLRWKNEELWPHCIGDRPSYGVQCRTDGGSLPDHVVVYGDLSRLTDDQRLLLDLTGHYALVHTDAAGPLAVFTLRQR